MTHHILVIDDNKTFTDGICSHLKNDIPNCMATGCYSGLEAESILKTPQAVPFDCIILDLILPCRKGGDLLAMVLKEAPGIPLIVVTGVVDNQLRTTLLEAGVQMVCNKPVSPEDLETAVIDSIHRNIYVRKMMPGRSSLDSAWRKAGEMREQINKAMEAATSATTSVNEMLTMANAS